MEAQEHTGGSLCLLELLELLPSLLLPVAFTFPSKAEVIASRHTFIMLLSSLKREQSTRLQPLLPSRLPNYKNELRPEHNSGDEQF